VYVDSGMGLSGVPRDRHLDLAIGPWAVTRACSLRSVTESGVRLARLNGSNKEAILRDVRVTHSEDAVVQSMEATSPCAVVDRVLG
jgi:hypothetical protein